MRSQADIPTLEKLRARRDEILGIAAGRGAYNVRVFGSVARGDAQFDSDIDFLVELDQDRTVLDLSELILDLREALDRDVDVFDSHRLSPIPALIQRDVVAL